MLEEERERPPDSYVKRAMELIPRWMEEQDWIKDGERVFYVTQVKVLLEDEFWHWITGKAIEMLIERGKLLKYRKFRMQNKAVIFIGLPGQSKRKVGRRISKYIKLINWYSKLSAELGKWAEHCFKVAMLENGFRKEAENTREWKGKTWKKSLEDLDFIFTKNDLEVGVEIKNKFSYEDLATWKAKADICNYLGLKGLFVARAIPMDHQYKMRNKNVFFLRFKSKLFPPMYREKVKELYEYTQLPVRAEWEFPEKAFNVFLKYYG